MKYFVLGIALLAAHAASAETVRFFSSGVIGAGPGTDAGDPYALELVIRQDADVFAADGFLLSNAAQFELVDGTFESFSLSIDGRDVALQPDQPLLLQSRLTVAENRINVQFNPDPADPLLSDNGFTGGFFFASFFGDGFTTDFGNLASLPIPLEITSSSAQILFFDGQGNVPGGSVTVQAASVGAVPVGAVPLPAALPLFIAALGALTLAARRRV